MFKIWYDDGSSFEFETENEWNLLPVDGVLIVKGPIKTKNSIYQMGCDYYFMEGSTVKSCNRPDLDRYLRRDIGLKNVKFGRWADNKIWNQVHQEASEWL